MILKHPVEIHTLGNFNGRVATIRSVEAPDAPTIYTLHDEDDRHVATCSSPKPLASHAFAANAITVVHSYDLRAAERS